jgi:hypothetical protein
VGSFYGPVVTTGTASRGDQGKGTNLMGTPETESGLKPGDEAAPGTPGTGDDICPDCHGTGKRDGKPCETCAGSGTITRAIGGG